MTGTLEVTASQAAELTSDLWYLVVVPGPSFFARERGQIMNVSNPKPSLRLLQLPTAVVLQWPTSSREFFLETTTILSPGIQWQSVTNRVEIEDQIFSVKLDRESESKFFRLRRAP